MKGFFEQALTLLLINLILLVASCKNETRESTKLQIGAVSTACPEATQVGKQILMCGGNAADAAIAISFALAVAEPAMSGLGGGTQVIMSTNDGIPFAINGSTLSPKHVEKVASKDSLKYLQKSTIPSTLKVLNFLYEQYSSGEFTWAELVQPAIDLCRNGFVVGPYRALVYKRHREDLLNSPFPLDLFVDDQGHFPTEGSRIRQPALANTLEIIANEGAESFYSGSLSHEISKWMTDNEGWISSEDLAAFPIPQVQKAIKTQYRDHMIYSMSPPCGGWVVCKILNELNNYDPKLLKPSEDSRLNALAKSLHSSHEQRRLAPIQNLQDYEGEVNDILDKESGETTHFSVADNEGMTLAVTSSINAYFGCKTGDPNLGFLFNTYMDDFIFDDSTNVYALGPTKMAYSSMSPTIIQKDGKNVLAIGSPGSSRIISAVAQCSQLFIDSPLSLDSINRFARIHTSRDRIMIESTEHIQSLSELIHHRNWDIYSPATDLALPPLNAYFGGVHMVGIRNDKWEASADPRRDGTAWAN